MSPDTVVHDAQRAAHAAAAGYDAYARAEHMLRCYGAGYVCRHPQLLFGRLPDSDLDHRIGSAQSHGPYGFSRIDTHPGPGHHDVGEDDLLMRVLRVHQVLDEIYGPCRVPAPEETVDQTRQVRIREQQ